MSRKVREKAKDAIFRYAAVAAGASLLLLLSLFFYELTTGSLPSIWRFGAGYITGSTWNPVTGVFGAAPMVYGSLLSSLLALTMGVPVSLGVAVLLAEFSPPRVAAPLSFIVELLAAVPSVVYGMWGLFVLAPAMRVFVYPQLETYLGFLPIFQGTIFGVGMLTAGLVLAIMIVPIVASISRDALLAVPSSQREAAYALGATRWEVVKMSVISYARPGIIGAVFLGFGRAFGETMAVTMVIGNTPQISSSLFAPGYTLASVIANEFTEATYGLYVSALVEAGLLLLLISFVVNVGARLLIRRFVRGRAEHI
jgi:phosphate transport system permease protein